MANKFGSSLAEGEFLALLAHLAPVEFTGEPRAQPPLWLGVIGKTGYWPLKKLAFTSGTGAEQQWNEVRGPAVYSCHAVVSLDSSSAAKTRGMIWRIRKCTAPSSLVVCREAKIKHENRSDRVAVH